MTKILEDLKFLKTYHVEAQKEKEGSSSSPRNLL